MAGGLKELVPKDPGGRLQTAGGDLEAHVPVKEVLWLHPSALCGEGLGSGPTPPEALISYFTPSSL